MKQKITNGLSPMHGFLNKILKGLFGLTARQRADESTYSAANESTFVKKPVITDGKKIIKNELSENAYEMNNEDKVINSYPNLRNDKYVLEFFEYDYAPRFQRQNKFTPLLYVNLAKNIYSNTPINVYNNNNDFAEGGYEHNNNAGTFLGFDSLANPQVYLNNKYKLTRPVLIHELTHAFRQGTLGVTGDNRFSSYKTPINLLPKVSIGKVYNGSGYTSTEKDKLNKAYNMDGYKINYDPLWEKGTTNTEVRFRLWKELYDKLGRRPTLEETDKFIRGYDNNRLGRTIKNANGYGWQMYENGINLNDAKDALINVAMNDTPESNDYVDYAKRGIKIRKGQAGLSLVTPEMELSKYQGEVTPGKTFGDKVKDIGRAVGLFIPFIGTGLDTEERQGYAAAVGAMKDAGVPAFTFFANNKLGNRTYRGWDRKRHRNKNYGKPYINSRFARPLAKGLGVAGLILDTPNMVADIENLKRALGFNYNHQLLMKE